MPDLELFSDEDLWNIAQSPLGLSDEQIQLIRLIRELRSIQKDLPIASEILQECDRKLCPLLVKMLSNREEEYERKSA